MALSIGVSPVQLINAAANVESTYGTLPTFTPSSMAFNMTNSPNPVKPRYTFQDLPIHQSSWTKQKSLPTTFLMPLNFTMPLVGGTAAGTVPTLSPILEAAALHKGTIGTITTGLKAKASTVQAIGVTAIVCTTAASTGACALGQGDIITFSGDTQKYVVTSPATDAVAATDVTVNINPAKVVALAGGEDVAVVTSVPYTPANIGNYKSASVAYEFPGAIGSTDKIVQEVNGVFCSVRFNLTFDRGPLCEVTGAGLYQFAKSNTNFATVYGSAAIPPANNTNKFILSGGNRVAINNGAGTYYGILSSVVFDLGVTYPEIDDVNSGATFGIYALQVADRNPTMTINFAFDTNHSSAVRYLDFQQDANTGNPHMVYFAYVDLAGRTWHVSAPTAQVINQVPGEQGANRSNSVTYKIQSATPEGEFSMSHA